MNKKVKPIQEVLSSSVSFFEDDSAGIAAAKEAVNELYLASVLTEDEKNEVTHAIAAYSQSGTDAAEIKIQLKILAKAARLCIENAQLPYYTLKVAAQGFVCLLDGSAAIEDVRLTVIDVCDLALAPECVHMVISHYRRALDDIGEDPGRIALLKRAYHKGFISEHDYKGCAQCTLATMFDITGHKEPMVFQAASGLAGGMALCGDGACGGYSGGILFMGTLAGRRLDFFDGDIEAKRESYRMAQTLHDKIVDVYGSIRCKDIHTDIFGRSYLIRDTQDSARFEEMGAHKDKCTNVVGYICMLITEILLDDGYLTA